MLLLFNYLLGIIADHITGTVRLSPDLTNAIFQSCGDADGTMVRNVQSPFDGYVLSGVGLVLHKLRDGVLGIQKLDEVTIVRIAG